MSGKKLAIRYRMQQEMTADVWRDLVLASEAFLSRRSDWQRNVAAVVNALADTAWGPGLTTRTTWEKMCEAASVSRSTLARVLAWLHRMGWLHTRSTGVPARRSISGHNEAADYQLVTGGSEMPVIDAGLAADIAELTPPKNLTKDLSTQHAREGLRHGAQRRVSRTDNHITTVGVGEVVKTKRDALRWAQTLRENCPALAAVSLRRLRHLAKPLWANGWTVRDALGAMELAPDGTVWAAAGGHVRSEAGFALAKLRRWVDSGLGPCDTVRNRGHQVLVDASHAATKAQAVGFGGTGTPAYTDTRQVVHVIVLPGGTLRVARAGGLYPWERVRVGIERAPGVRERVADLSSQRPAVDLPHPLGDLFVRVDNDHLCGEVLRVDLSDQAGPNDAEGNGLGFLCALFPKSVA